MLDKFSFVSLLIFFRQLIVPGILHGTFPGSDGQWKLVFGAFRCWLCSTTGLWFVTFSGLLSLLVRKFKSGFCVYSHCFFEVVQVIERNCVIFTVSNYCIMFLQ